MLECEIDKLQINFKASYFIYCLLCDIFGKFGVTASSSAIWFSRFNFSRGSTTRKLAANSRAVILGQLTWLQIGVNLL